MLCASHVHILSLEDLTTGHHGTKSNGSLRGIQWFRSGGNSSTCDSRNAAGEKGEAECQWKRPAQSRMENDPKEGSGRE